MSFTRKIKAGLVPIARTQFVGEPGTIFYDPNNGNLFLSDGVTPGGQPIALSGSTGFTGSRGDTGLGFRIAKSYVSVAALQADTSPSNIVAGEFAIVETGNIEDAENSRLYLWNGSVYSYVTDLSGAVGITGPQGVAGFTGSQGIQGNTGFVGSQGIQGIQGNTGFVGSQGIQGLTGFVGSQGIQGDVGFVGSQGIQGIQGNIGFTGSIGYTGSVPAGNVTSITSLSSINYINFNTAATYVPAAGNLGFDSGDSSLNFGLAGGNTTLKVGEQQYAYVFNAAGVNLTKGQLVYVFGAQGNRVSVKLAQANSEEASRGTLGMVAEPIAIGATGWVQTSGPIYKLNTSTLTEGNTVFLSATVAGGITEVKPIAPDHLVVIGWVERADSTVGSIYLKIDNGYELDELHNVYINNPQNGQALTWNSTALRWENNSNPGFTGSQGIQGLTGFVGSQGNVGYTGSQGIQGNIGYTGSEGIQGIQGNIGYTGSEGIQGIQGIQGNIGYTGSKGDIGYTGSRGDLGYTGSKGDTGLGFNIAKTYSNVAALTADVTPSGIVAGEFALINTGNVEDADNSKLYLWTGSAYIYVNDLSGAAGITGPQGTTGFTGSQGDAGFTGSQGAQGTTGFTGSQGIQGVIGFTGSQGAQGTTGFTGSQGTAGSTGSTGFTGSQGGFSTSSDAQVNSIGVGTAASGTTGEIRATNNITAYYSDDRLKTRLGEIENALDKVKSLSGFYYQANETAQQLGYESIREVGVSAQEVQAVMPEIVVPAPIDDKYLTVRYEKLVPLLIEAIKELDRKISQLK